MAWSGGVTFVLLKTIGALSPLRANAGEEGLGLDVSQHGEEAYTSGEGALLLLRDPVALPLRDLSAPVLPSEVNP